MPRYTLMASCCTNTINNNNVLTQTGTGLHSASRISRLLWKDAK